VPVIQLDHVNIRTANLDRLSRFYVEVLGLILSENPDQARRGHWLGCGGRPILHLVESDVAAPSPSPQLEHFGLLAMDVDEVLARLASSGVSYNVVRSDDTATLRIHLRDPDDNRLHIDILRQARDRETVRGDRR
jgi:catechol-2,3-dioxygenase